jgi:GT2 family glycosyltransferase
MIHYFTPYCPEKRLGHIHNYYCSLVPDDDWICIMDPDVMFLQPDTQAHIAKIIEQHGNDWDILGCMTNRIGVPDQIFTPSGFDNVNIAIHQNYAKEIYYSYLDKIVDTKLVAGFLILFKKSLWNKIKFQEGINFDIKFCEAVKAQGGRIGIMKGIYVLHLYRFGQKNPKSYKKHLLK